MRTVVGFEQNIAVLRKCFSTSKDDASDGKFREVLNFYRCERRPPGVHGGPELPIENLKQELILIGGQGF